MSQESISIETTKVDKPLNIAWQGASLRWKISVAFSGLILMLGVLVIGIVYSMTDNALHRQVDLRAVAIATNLSDASAAYVSRQNTLELDVLIAKYGRLDGVAYAYIQDSKGDVIATSLQPFPSELKDSSGVERRTAHSSVTNIRGKSIYDTRVPLLEGQLGTVHVGLWADSIQTDVRGTVFTIIALIAGCLAVGILLSLVLAAKAIRPLMELKASADEISRGQLDTPVTIRSTDEVGELARSLERMRASLKAAMVRLNRE